MWPSNLELVMLMEREQDLREAQQERLVRQALEASGHRPGWHNRVLAWLGRQLVAWGCGLQKRYSLAATNSPCDSGHPSYQVI